MTAKLHIRLAQINPVVGDLAYNFEKICDVWGDASPETDLIIFPEMAICGYPPEDLILKPSFLKHIEDYIQKIVAFSKGKRSAAIVPTPWAIAGKTYNAMLVIEDGKITHTLTKFHLPNYGVFDEQRVFHAGPKPDPVPFRGISLGLMICEDMWYPDISANLKKHGADILITCNASPYETDKRNIRYADARERVSETGLPLLYLNQVGGQDELVFDGDSFLMNAKGDLVFESEKFVEDSYDILIEKNDTGVIFTSVHTLPASFSQTEEIYQALMLGLRDYIRKNNFPGVLLGLSGGIDSALSAAIAVDALGPENVRGVTMSSVYTSNDSVEDAETLAENLNIRIDHIPIKKIVDAFHDTLGGYLTGAVGTTLENLQPRARGTILMALSNASGKMVLSTGNKSEMAVGYATLYGDMCGGFNVLKDVYKTQVYELSEWRNAHKPFSGFGPAGAIIPERSITKAPTAELRPNQTDQDTLPPYEILDGILQHMIEDELGIDAIAAKGFDAATVRNVWLMLDRAEYKRRQAPPGIKITRKAFGRDRRYPITNHYAKIINQ